MNGPNLYQAEESDPVDSDDASGLETSGSTTLPSAIPSDGSQSQPPKAQPPVIVQTPGVANGDTQITFIYTGHGRPVFKQSVYIVLDPGFNSPDSEKKEHGGKDPTSGYIGDNGSGDPDKNYGTDANGKVMPGFHKSGNGAMLVNPKEMMDKPVFNVPPYNPKVSDMKFFRTTILTAMVAWLQQLIGMSLEILTET